MRIVSLIQFALKSNIVIDENPDLTLPISAAMKVTLQDKVVALQAEIKKIVGAW